MFGIQFNRDLGTVIRGAEGVRTLRLPNTVRQVTDEAFQGANAPRSVFFNDGPEVFGIDSIREIACGAYRPNPGIFTDS